MQQIVRISTIKWGVLCLLLAAGTSQAQQQQGIKPCEELKGEIAAQLDAKGVKNYTLEIVTNDQVGDKKIIGSCDGGAKKITYARH